MYQLNFLNPMYILFAVVIVLVCYIIFKYNSFISLRTRVQEAWADIDVQLKRRYDLIPNLVNTVKGYATHESIAFEKITQARSAAMGAKTMDEHSKSESMLGSAVTGLFGIAEAYPDLKANTNFIALQSELADTENKIMASRRFYNTNTRDMNAGIAMFPGNIIAKIFNFTCMDFFQLEEGSVEKNNVEVKF